MSLLVTVCSTVPANLWNKMHTANQNIPIHKARLRVDDVVTIKRRCCNVVCLLGMIYNNTCRYNIENERKVLDPFSEGYKTIRQCYSGVHVFIPLLKDAGWLMK